MLFFKDSKSWTPKILSDIVSRKKIQPECKEDNPLELLPEKRTKTPMKKDKDNGSAQNDEPGNKQNTPLIIRALEFVTHDLNILNYSENNESTEQVKSSNSLEKAVNDLFINVDDNEEENH